MHPLYKELNGKYVLFNYKSVRESPNCLHYLKKYNLHGLVDSGAFSLFNQAKKKEQYPFQQQELFSEEILDEMTLEACF